MKVWGASFWLAQEWLWYVLLAGLLAIAAEGRLDRLGLLVDLRRRLGLMPDHLDIEHPLRWLGVTLVAIWIVLSIAFTIATRARIYRDNQVGPKR
ncbi:MAG TPA: hypothetical protein VF619_11460 [Allosphingosinicella sp.]